MRSGVDAGRFAEWNRQLAGLVSTANRARVPQILSEALDLLVDSDDFSGLVFAESHKPAVLFQGKADSWFAEDLENYINGAYLLDPFYRAGIEGIEAGVYTMADIAPPAFLESEYYKSYYQGSPVADELGFICYLSDPRFDSR